MTCSIPGCSKRTEARGWCASHYAAWRAHGDPLKSLTAKNGELSRWIKDHIDFAGPDCLIWPFSSTKGYPGPVRYEGRSILATRLMCQLVRGSAPTPLHHAAHSCGNGGLGCIHPKHLRWATPAENEADKIDHGTALFGVQRPTSKLDDDAVRLIRASNESQEVTARRFGVSRNAVRQVLSGKTWSHVR